jgi:hypothetical protein
MNRQNIEALIKKRLNEKIAYVLSLKDSGKSVIKKKTRHPHPYPA